MPHKTTRINARGKEPDFLFSLYYIIAALFALFFPTVFIGGGLVIGGGYSRSAFFAVASLLVVFVFGIALRLRYPQRFCAEGRTKERLFGELSLGAPFILAAYTLVSFAAPANETLYPIVYIAIALIAAYYGGGATAILVSYAVIIEALSFFAAYGDAPKTFPALSHIAFIILFALLFTLFAKVEVIRGRLRGERTLNQKLEQMEQEALDYRLISLVSMEAAPLSKEERQTRRQFSSVAALKNTIYDILSVVKESVNPDTLALYLLEPSGESLKLKECITERGEAVLEKIPAAEGFAGSIVKHKQPLAIDNIKSSKSGITYYAVESGARSFIGYPLMEGEFVRGVILCDSEKKGAFGETSFSLLDAASRQILSAMTAERLLNALDAKRERNEKLYRASEGFNNTLTLPDVYKVLFATAREIIRTVDFLAVSLILDDNRNESGIVAVEGDERELLLTKRCPAGQSLVSGVIKTGSELPHTPFDQMDDKKRVVFFEGESLPPLKSLKVMPLISQKGSIGAFVIGSRKRNVFDEDALDILRVAVNQAAISISNAKMYQRMETLAVTDGLTGLINHRSFQEKLSEALARADRSGKPLAFMLTDIDHFKKINDTYGHPIGDEVLKKVAATLKSGARDIDAVARYGGEEFAVIMEMSDARGALKIAERIRKEVKRLSFSASGEKFSITLSAGIAEYPKDAGEKHLLIDIADEGLYYAKRNGRDMAVHLPSLKGGKKMSLNSE
ncbi:MAG: hypothetical protein Kow0090_09640 [Myxococcota bacterium]